MRRGYVDLDHGQVHYREAGDGPALLLLHETASSSVMYERAAGFLADRFRVVALDTPGFGMSDRLPGRPDMAGYARVAGDLLARLGVARAGVAGFHTGAGIGIELAAARPDLVAAGVFVGVLPLGTDEERAKWHELIVHPWEPDWNGEFLDFHLKLLQSFIPEGDGELLLQELIPRLQAGGDYWHAYEAVIAHESLRRAGEIRVPTLYATPVEDMLVEETRKAQQATPESEWAELPGGGAAVRTHPREFAELVAGFVGRHLDA